MADPEGKVPDFDEQLHEVLQGRIDAVPATCIADLDGDFTEAMTGEGGDFMVMTNVVPLHEAEPDPRVTSVGGNRDSKAGDEGEGGVYSRGALVYRWAGWSAPLPLPPGAKFPPPTGWTGREGRWPDDEQIDRWVREADPRSNLALRLRYGVIGIDVDAYEGKTGGLTLAEAESRYGPLPPTWRSTARLGDNVSGIRLFRVPVGVHFRSVIGFKELGIGDIEIVQPHHRFAMCWPSIHPKTGEQYGWFGPDDALLPEGQVPHVDDLPELPDEWVAGLSINSVREEFFDGSAPNRPREELAVVDEKVYQKLRTLTDDGDPDAVVATRRDEALLELISGAGSRYDSTRDHVAGLMRLRNLGYRGVPQAIAKLFSAYVLLVGDTRPVPVAEAEFWRFTEGAALLIAATSPSDPWKIMGTAGPGAVETHTDAAGDGPSWSPVDTTDLLDSDYVPPVPTLFVRSDGQGLLYPGLVHSFHGESESGKSLIIQVECVRLINTGQKVLYLDFESDAASVVARLREFGADPAAIADRFHYVHPEMRPDSEEERLAWGRLLSIDYALAVIDGVTDALGIFGCSTIDNDDIAGWIRTVPKQIASRTGAAVVLIDHVTKDASTRNRWAIGGQAKMAGLTGAAYTVKASAPLGRGLRGEVELKIGKDRPGVIRASCGKFSGSDRTQPAASIVVDATVSPPAVTICAPGAGDTSGEEHPFRPTNLMQRASQAIEQEPGTLTKTRVAERAGGHKASALKAVDILCDEGYAERAIGPKGHDVYTSIKSYRETDDPRSDRFHGQRNDSNSNE